MSIFPVQTLAARDTQAPPRALAVVGPTGSGKTALALRLRDSLDKEGRVIVSHSLTLDKAKITVPLLIAALFYDLSTEKAVTISSQSERRERDVYSTQSGHGFHGKLDTHSTRTWTVGA